MPYSTNLPEAARRHLEAADLLYAEPGIRRDVAGYLYGIAAECALKHISRRSDLMDHFPRLKTRLLDEFRGRAGVPRLIQRFTRKEFMADWHIEMRYSDAKQISLESVERWQKDAKTIIAEMSVI